MNAKTLTQHLIALQTVDPDARIMTTDVSLTVVPSRSYCESDLNALREAGWAIHTIPNEDGESTDDHILRLDTNSPSNT